MNLDGLHTTTQVSWYDKNEQHDDKLILNGTTVTGSSQERVIGFLDIVRMLAGVDMVAVVNSRNNFPAGAGIASSASAFAALALASTRALGLELDQAALSRLARRGSGSACRSVPGGFVEWAVGNSDEDSFAASIAPPEHWPLTDVIAILSSAHKSTGSTEGHALAGTSPLQSARLEDSCRRLDICRQAILSRDFAALAEIVETDSNLMHAVMLTSQPALFYWQPETLAIIQAIRVARGSGLPACCTVDAGPNVHVICEEASVGTVEGLLRDQPGVREVRHARVGGPTQVVDILG